MGSSAIVQTDLRDPGVRLTLTTASRSRVRTAEFAMTRLRDTRVNVRPDIRDCRARPTLTIVSQIRAIEASALTEIIRLLASAMRVTRESSARPRSTSASPILASSEDTARILLMDTGTIWISF